MAIIVRNLNEKQEQALSKWTYTCIDNSLAYRYIYNPFWTKLASLTPVCISPNLLTIIGSLAMWLYPIYEMILNPKMETSHDYSKNFYYLCAFLHFIGHTADGMDGKVARLKKISGPMGETIDHGFDIINQNLWILGITSIFGVTSGKLTMFVLLTFPFSVSALHNSKLFNGYIILPALMDLSHTLIVGFLFSMGYFGKANTLQFSVFGLNLEMVFLILLTAGPTFTVIEFFLKTKPEFRTSYIRSMSPIMILASFFTIWYLRFDFHGHENSLAIRFFYLYYGFKSSTYVLMIIFAQQTKNLTYWKQNPLFFTDLVVVCAGLFVSNDFLVAIQLGCLFAIFQWCIAFYSLLKLYSVRYGVPFILTPEIKSK